jgi:Domain of unknown function (DUF5122) beta-propeller
MNTQLQHPPIVFDQAIAGLPLLFRTRTGLGLRAVLVAGLALVTALPEAHAAPGDVDLTFDPGSCINGTVAAMAVQTNGTMLIGGNFTTVQGAMRNCIALLNADGSPASGFSPAVTNAGFDTWVDTIAVQADGKVLIGGAFTLVNGLPQTNVARLNPDGSLDGSFQFHVASGG